MDNLRERLVQRVLAQVDLSTLEQDPEGYELGQRQAQMMLVQELVSAFSASLDEEGFTLTTSQRRWLLEDVASSGRLAFGACGFPRRILSRREIEIPVFSFPQPVRFPRSPHSTLLSRSVLSTFSWTIGPM